MNQLTSKKVIMTNWDKIYKDFQKGGEAWATLSEEIHPFFVEFLDKSHFDIKYVLDIGCGTGKYLKFLQAKGFKTNGIDSSETAVEMSKKLLDNNSQILCVNMFEYEIPSNKYDLIISIAAIHHGTKDQVQGLINKIHEALTKGGKIFITLPDFDHGLKYKTFKNNIEVAPGTYSPLSGPEIGLAHSFYREGEVNNLFSNFNEVEVSLDNIGRWVVQASK